MASYRARLQSDAAVYAPGVVRFAQARYSEGAHEHAREIINCWNGMPADVVEALLKGEAATEVDAEEALIVTVERPDEMPADIAA